MKNISSKFIANSLIISLGLVILFITGLISYRVWFVAADAVMLPEIGIAYSQPTFYETTVPDWRIVTPSGSNFPFLEVYNSDDVQYAMGSSNKDYPVYKQDYYITEGDHGIVDTRKFAIVPLPNFDYLVPPVASYTQAVGYSAEANDAADRLLKRIQSKVGGGSSQKALIDQAVESYTQAIRYSQSTVRCPDGETLYFKNSDFQHMIGVSMPEGNEFITGDADVGLSESFPPQEGVTSLVVLIRNNYTYINPKNNSLALNVLNSAKTEANRIGNQLIMQKVQAAIENYRGQIQETTDNEALTITAPAEVQFSGETSIEFRVNKNSLAISQPNYLKTLRLTLNDNVVCDVSFSNATSGGTTSSPNCQWNSESLSGSFTWNINTGNINQQIGTQYPGGKTIKLKAFASNSGPNTPPASMIQVVSTISPDWGSSSGNTHPSGAYGINIIVPRSTNRVNNVEIKVSANDLRNQVKTLGIYVCNGTWESVSAGDSGGESQCHPISSDWQIGVENRPSLSETTKAWDATTATSGQQKTIMVKAFSATQSPTGGSQFLAKVFSDNISITDVPQDGDGDGDDEGGGGGGGTGGGGGEPPADFRDLIANFRASGIKTVQAMLNRVGSFTLMILGFLAVIGIIIAGMKYISSGGDEKKAETGKKALLFTVYGIIIAVTCITLLNMTINEVGGIIRGVTPKSNTLEPIIEKINTTDPNSTEWGGPNATVEEIIGQSNGMVWRFIRLAALYAEGVALFLILYASFLYMTSYGDESKAESAKKTIIWSLIGLAVVISASTLLNLFSGSLQTTTTALLTNIIS